MRRHLVLLLAFRQSQPCAWRASACHAWPWRILGGFAILGFALLAPACLDGASDRFNSEPIDEAPTGPAPDDGVVDVPDDGVPDDGVPDVPDDGVVDVPDDVVDEVPDDGVPDEEPPLTDALAPTLLVDEQLDLAGAKHPIRPSLVIDDEGRPYFYVTTFADGADTAGYLTRDDQGWHRVSVVSAPSGGIGYGGGLAYGFVDRTPEGRLQVWVWRDVDGATSADNRTDVFEPADHGWTVVDSVDSIQVYQLLRLHDGGLAALGHYGGNNYVVEPGGGGWHQTFFPAQSNRPVGAVTAEGTVAVVGSDLRLIHFGAPEEWIDHGADREQHPIGPVAGGDGLLRVLRQTSWQLGNRVTLSTRTARSAWSHTLVAEDPAIPASSGCPQELGAECAWEVDHVQAIGLAVADDQAIPLVVRRRTRVSYERECLAYDQDYQGCALPPCVEEGGPSGPWLTYPHITPTADATLEVAGHEVPLDTPILTQVRPAVAVDERGHLHLAWVHDRTFRYVRIALYPPAPASSAR